MGSRDTSCQPSPCPSAEDVHSIESISHFLYKTSTKNCSFFFSQRSKKKSFKALSKILFSVFFDSMVKRKFLREGRKELIKGSFREWEGMRIDEFAELPLILKQNWRFKHQNCF